MDFPLSGDAVRAAFLFGKLPTHGDFVARGLSDSDSGALDDYLSASLSQAAMLEDFDDLYATAPTWRFVAQVGAGQMCGVIAPSVDKVGRQFPILVGVAADSASDLMIDSCEAHLYEAFATAQTADALYAALSQFPDVGSADGLRSPGWFLEDEDRTVVDRLEGNRPEGLMRRMVESARLRG